MKNRVSGFTLVELMMAMGLLVLLGSLLMVIFRGVMDVWKVADEQRMFAEDARNIIECLQEDMEALYHHDLQRGLARLELDFDRYGQQRLRFIRKISQESQHILLRNAGAATVQQGYSHFYSSKNLTSGKYRATGGIGEVVYLFSPFQNSLEFWRGFRCPPGRSESCWLNSNLLNSIWIKKNCDLLSDSVLLCWFSCWDENTIRWTNSSSEWIFESGRKEKLPLKLRVILIMRGEFSPQAVLNKDINIDEIEWFGITKQQNFPVLPSSCNYYVHVGNEWMEFQECTSDRVIGLKRGMFKTKPVAHKQGTKVEWGTCFSIVISFPTSIISME
ncbi:MAG: prepilin-type N-terminal cleavage/methylation domain-containing protein [Planctomycetes bacterium]|jgi:type II secretory pathway pseudopilin PulG|nr:prepilin-type N-terminal cleavage/methylation domain-containing protein [Planctomycetota bacterium]HON44785.1 prepilin-type N-terminal cleavage/methylation domain-containing protein [Planctomycetota bacterium]HRU51041.1 prepilin-type N-terminal cleavage/methylation domain-containing protein [Planctomycetota bacterium]